MSSRGVDVPRVVWKGQNLSAPEGASHPNNRARTCPNLPLHMCTCCCKESMETSRITTMGCTWAGESQTELFVNIVGTVWPHNQISGPPRPQNQWDAGSHQYWPQNGGVLNRSYKNERNLIFSHAIIKKTLGVCRDRNISSIISSSMDLWYRGLHAGLLGCVEAKGASK